MNLAVDSQAFSLFPDEGSVGLTVSKTPELILDQTNTQRTGVFADFEGVKLFIELRYGAESFGDVVPVLVYEMHERPGFLELEPQAKATLLSVD